MRKSRKVKNIQLPIHTNRNNGKIKKIFFHVKAHPLLDKRYSPNISSICDKKISKWVNLYSRLTRTKYKLI